MQDQYKINRSFGELAPGNRVHLRVVFDVLHDVNPDGTTKRAIGYGVYDALGVRFGVFRTISGAKRYIRKFKLCLVSAPEGR
jgi:hypothetical protein